MLQLSYVNNIMKQCFAQLFIFYNFDLCGRRLGPILKKTKTLFFWKNGSKILTSKFWGKSQNFLKYIFTHHADPVPSGPWVGVMGSVSFWGINPVKPDTSENNQKI